MHCVIDIGSNTIRLVVYRVDSGRIRAILNNKCAAGLASYVDKRNYMRPEGTERLIEVLQEFRTILDMLPDCPVYPFATASLRNIVNTEQVLDEVRQKTGFAVRVLSGYEEAMLDYRGAVRRMPEKSGLLADIGGGSTELVFFKDSATLAAKSIPIGSLSLYSRFVSGLFPTKKELRVMAEAVEQTLLSMLPPDPSYLAQPLCGVGGTARSTYALYRRMRKEVEPEQTYDCTFLRRILRQAEEEPHKLLRRILKLDPERVHTLLPGILILQTIAEVYGSRSVLTSPYGVREGYLSFMLEKEGIYCV